MKLGEYIAMKRDDENGKTNGLIISHAANFSRNIKKLCVLLKKQGIIK